MKIIYEFDSENESDMTDLPIFQNSFDISYAIKDADNHLRDAYKYGSYDEQTLSLIEDVRKILCEYIF